MNPLTDFPKNELLSWYGQHKRDLPWRNTNDPYRIWISEIMLQQTRIDTAIPYYHRFIEAFPSVQDLADANQQEVLKQWEGLGYYSRARNLHQASKTVADKFNGMIPRNEKQIRELKGIGPYTSAAILSIAFDKPHAVVDGNVIRVLSRFFGIRKDIRNQKTKNQIQDYADSILDKNHPGDFNQAIMELGATVCTPSNPNCVECPLSSLCQAFKTAETDSIPYKSKSKKVPHHHIGVGLIVNRDQQLLIALRPDEAMLGGLWEFPGGKKKATESIEQTVVRELKEELGVDVEILGKLMNLKHAYSHFKITLHAYWCRINDGTPAAKTSQEVRWVSIAELNDYPFPKANKTLVKKLEKDGIKIEPDLF